MSIESDLKRDGIEVIEPLDTLKINSLARNISIKLCETFPNFGLDQNELFIKLSSCFSKALIILVFISSNS